MNTLISEKYESAFVKMKNQRSILQYLVSKAVKSKEPDVWQKFEDECLCGTHMKAGFRKIITTFINLCLNNYSKMRNDNLQRNKADANSEKKCKVQTLEKV